MMARPYYGLLKTLKLSGKVWYWCRCGQVAKTTGSEQAPNLLICHCGRYMIMMDYDCLPHWPHYELD